MKTYQRIVKRVVDIALSSILPFLFLPIMVIIALVIKLESEGPIIFRQKRVGQNGRLFTLYKFRTMVRGAEKLKEKYLHLNEAKPPLFKIKNDPRLTRIGKLLRDTNLDELPQLINVLKGDMSIVGPRPALPEEVEQYESWQKKRLLAKPGITSFWHVSLTYKMSGRKAYFDDWVLFDVCYIDNYSFSLDLKILFLTIRSFIYNLDLCLSKIKDKN